MRATDWIITGQKVWTTNAQNAERILLLARTAPRRPEAPLDGLTLFFTRLDRERCTIRRIDKLGRAAVDSNEVFFDGLVAADEEVVGEVGRGFYHLLSGLNPERIVIALEAVGIGQWAVEYASEYARNRIVFDRPIGQNQAIAHPLADVWAALEAAELLAYKAAWLFDHGRPCGRRSQRRQAARRARPAFAPATSRCRPSAASATRASTHVERLWREVRLYAHRADHPGDGAQLPGGARAGAAEVVLEVRTQKSAEF